MTKKNPKKKLISIENFHLTGLHKILLADRNPLNRKRNVSLLQQVGYVVDLAETSKDVIAKVTAGNVYDALLIDFSFFDNTALGTIQHIAQRSNDKSRVVILISDVLAYATTFDFNTLGLSIMGNPLSAVHVEELIECNEIFPDPGL